jgi:RNA polymerase sigma-70 factor, ECF subfamily
VIRDATFRWIGVRLQDFEQIFRDNVSRIYRISYHYLGNPDAAEDATQETFLRALQSVDSFKQNSNPSTWLFRIAVNVCLDGLRKQKRHRINALAAVRDHADHSLPAEDFERAELRFRVRQAVDELPPDLKILIVLREFEELSYQEISAVTGLSIGTISSRLNRARLDIAKIFHQEFRRH